MNQPLKVAYFQISNSQMLKLHIWFNINHFITIFLSNVTISVYFRCFVLRIKVSKSSQKGVSAMVPVA